ncbi:acyl-CoA dehydrogenase family protein [Gordonia sp. (in: high G+C Gram-positive bacteria)]|uniref:acyl-CoA dehydrogenase family protein n=1 Tax=Gordonia sp. (in: high G+C Gram-positive bacteria) TaxID=84139 RepID=UPI003F97DCEE
MKRTFYADDHDYFRLSVAEFVKRYVEPNRERWDEERIIDRDVWVKAGEQGVIGLSIPEEFGGAGQARDYRFRQVVTEELNKAGAGSLSASWALHDDIVGPYFVDLGDHEQRRRWLPGIAAGAIIPAIAMTEPGTGSDLRGIKTTATKVDGGWRINGVKTFITSGYQADLVVVVAKTGDGNGARDFSLFVVTDGAEGFTRGRKLAKMGLPAQDTAELFFDDVFVPDSDVLGEIGLGFKAMMEHLPLERLSIAGGALASMEAAFGWTVAHVTDRVAFGKRIGDFQATRFRLADLATEVAATQAFVDRAIGLWNSAELTATDAATAKLWASEAQSRTLDACVQLHGGYGYMLEYPITRAFVDGRVQRIYGGTSEIMRELIGREVMGER